MLIHRLLALALVNALHHRQALGLPEDPGNEPFLDAMGIGDGTRVAMAGFFPPLVRRMEARGARLEVVDTGRGMGDGGAFSRRLGRWADAFVMTATAIPNGTADNLLAAVGPGVRVAILGPSTPLVVDAFDGLPVHLLAGTVPLDREAVFRAVRNGKGTPVLQRFGRKVVAVLEAKGAGAGG